MRHAELISLNCTQCGGALDVRGGGRVRVHVCHYCGAALDAQADYKVLTRYRDLPRPKAPFALGQTGQIGGVAFTVIGTIGWQEMYAGRKWNWVDHQLYSPTHGYAWLTWEDGWAVFTRKVRGAATPGWLSSRVIESAEQRPTVRFDGASFTYFASGRKWPTFIEGEFNYAPTMDMRPQYRSLLGRHRMLHMQRTDSEVEFELSELPPRDKTLLAFGAVPAKWPKERRVHPLSPYDLGPLAAFTRDCLVGGAVLALVLTAVLSALDSRVTRQSLAVVPAVEPVPFEITSDRGLVEFELVSDVQNGWIGLEGEVLDAGQNVVSAFADGAQYYSGRDSEGRWSEGSRRMRVRTHLPVGQYTLALAVDENVGDPKWSGRPASKLDVTIRQGVARLFWILGLGAAFLVSFMLFLAARGWHHSRRYATSDWSD